MLHRSTHRAAAYLIIALLALSGCGPGSPEPTAAPNFAPTMAATQTSAPGEGPDNTPAGVALRFWAAYTQSDVSTLESLMGDTLQGTVQYWGSPLKLIAAGYPDELIDALESVDVTVIDAHANSAVVDLHTTYDANPKDVIEIHHPITVGLYDGIWKITEWDNRDREVVTPTPPTRAAPTATPVGAHAWCAEFPAPRLLIIDNMAMVSPEATDALQVYLVHDLSLGTVAELQPGAGFLVKSAPYCDFENGYWYQIHADTSLPDGSRGPAIDGWILETDAQKNYLVLPCAEGTDCGVGLGM